MSETPALDMKRLEWLGTTGDAVWVVDALARIIVWNKGAEVAFGVSTEQAIGKPCYEVLGSVDQGGMTVCRPDCRFMTAARRGKELKHTELAMVSQGQDHPVQADLSFAWSHDEEGRLEFLAHVSRFSGDGWARTPERDGKASGNALEVRLFGPLSCYRDSHPISKGEWDRQKTKALFAYLVANHRRWLHKEEIIELLWPEMVLSQALGNLRVTLSRLRHVLEPSISPNSDSRFVRCLPHAVRFEPLVPCWVDSIHFEELAGRAPLVLGQRLHRDEVKRLNEAVLLYRGEYLQDWLYDDWTAPERRRLTRLYAQTLNALAVHHELSGDWAAAIERRGRLARIEPWQEETHYQLMQDYLRLGRPQDAISQYMNLRDILAAELGTPPSPRLTELYHRILTSSAS